MSSGPITAKEFFYPTTPQQIETIFQKGEHLLKKQQCSRASKAFRKVLEKDPSHQKARHFLEVSTSLEFDAKKTATLVEAVKKGKLLEGDLEGCDVNTRNEGEHLLHIASLKNAYNVVKMLLENGADDRLKNARGEKALEVAVEQGSLESAQLLLAAKRKREKREQVLKNAFGANDWRAYFGDIGPEPPLPSNIEEILLSPCPFWPERKIKDTHDLVLIPDSVGGKPLTLNYLEELIQSPKRSRPKQYWDFCFSSDDLEAQAKFNEAHCYEVIERYGEVEVEESHWVLMTKKKLPDQKWGKEPHWEKKIRESVDYELPQAIEAAAVILTHWFKTGKEIYPGGVDEDFDLVKCQKQVHETNMYGDHFNWPVCVGGFGELGLFIGDGEHTDKCRTGIAAVRRL